MNSVRHISSEVPKETFNMRGWEETTLDASNEFVKYTQAIVQGSKLIFQSFATEGVVL